MSLHFHKIQLCSKLLVYSFQFYRYRYDCSTNGTESFAMVIGSKFLETVGTCSMTTFMKCCPFTLFRYFFKTDWTWRSFLPFFIFSIYFFRFDSKICWWRPTICCMICRMYARYRYESYHTTDNFQLLIITCITQIFAIISWFVFSN